MNLKRTRLLNKIPYKSGGVVYWMSRDQRVTDNWALLFAQELAEKNHTTVSVVFCLRKKFNFATERLVDFMLGGLQEVEKSLLEKNISFTFLLSDPVEAVPRYINEHSSGALVTDFNPLRYSSNWKQQITKKITIPFYKVDAHNIVPVWESSPKQEFGAYTLRPKLLRKLPEFLEAYPRLKPQSEKLPQSPINWQKIRDQITMDTTVKKITWLNPGEKAAQKQLEEFLETHLSRYATKRNDMTESAQSELSPYLHFGQISAQRVALEVQDALVNAATKEAFLEELIVRKELSDNFCFYNPHYDNPDGFPAWAQQTLKAHAADEREYLYDLNQLEQAKTHDPLWNAAQKEMLAKGKMHGYLRMYWAKKIFEWSPTIAIAQKHAIYLNDKYFLDGRDPNGYAGIAWSMGGLHDRAWFERPVFGKIRYMNYNGAKRKFAIEKYIAENQ